MLVTIVADFFQYYICDRLGGADLSRADDTVDGVIGPVGTAMRICTGMQYGPLAVTLDFRETAPPPVEPNALASEADIELPSGTIDVWSFNGTRSAWHTFPQSGLARVRVEVIDRYKVHPDGSPAEQHKITVWPVGTASPRWRSQPS